MLRFFSPDIGGRGVRARRVHPPQVAVTRPAPPIDGGGQLRQGQQGDGAGLRDTGLFDMNDESLGAVTEVVPDDTGTTCFVAGRAAKPD